MFHTFTTLIPSHQNLQICGPISTKIQSTKPANQGDPLPTPLPIPIDKYFQALSVIGFESVIVFRLSALLSWHPSSRLHPISLRDNMILGYEKQDEIALVCKLNCRYWESISCSCLRKLKLPQERMFSLLASFGSLLFSSLFISSLALLVFVTVHFRVRAESRK